MELSGHALVTGEAIGSRADGNQHRSSRLKSPCSPSAKAAQYKLKPSMYTPAGGLASIVNLSARQDTQKPPGGGPAPRAVTRK